MNKYNPNIHHRRSIRLRNYDYSQEGFYYITMCVDNREGLFGNIYNKEMILNKFGEIVHNEWLKTAELRKNIQLHEFVVMPNHFHAILEIMYKIESLQNVGAYCNTPLQQHDYTPLQQHDYTPLQQHDYTPLQQHDYTPLQQMGTPFRSPSQTVGAIVRGFKTTTTIQINKIRNMPHEKFWQRNYYETIIRRQDDYARITKYIANNPLNWENDRFY
jgi:REP element-mobilizing transposase RayT